MGRRSGRLPQTLCELEKKLPKSFVKLCKAVSLHDSLVERPANPVVTISQTDDEGEQCRAIISLKCKHAEFDLIYLDLVKPTGVVQTCRKRPIQR